MFIIKYLIFIALYEHRGRRDIEWLSKEFSSTMFQKCWRAVFTSSAMSRLYYKLRMQNFVLLSSRLGGSSKFFRFVKLQRATKCCSTKSTWKFTRLIDKVCSTFLASLIHLVNFTISLLNFEILCLIQTLNKPRPSFKFN